MSKVYNKVCIVTGGGGGIGKSFCEELAISGARGIYVVDINKQSAKEVANNITLLATHPNFRVGYDYCNIGIEVDIKRVLQSAWQMFGSIDIYFSNAGIFTIGGISDEEVSNNDWRNIWEVNCMSHIYAARHLFPLWKENNIHGTFVITASAAGLLMQVGCLPYHVTKHAAVSIADWLAVHHHEDGVSIHCVCPQGVRTDMLTNSVANESDLDSIPAGLDGIVTPEKVAKDTIRGIKDGTFMILPHPKVKNYFQMKASDYDRWLKGMRRSKKHLESMLSTPKKSKL